MAIDDELINKLTWKIPNALALVGSAHEGERNGMTTSWITQLSMEPVLIGIGVWGSIPPGVPESSSTPMPKDA